MDKLTRKEENLMELFWENGPMFVRDLLERLPEPKPHFNTVSTFVRALEEKGFVGHEQFGNTFRYFARVSRDDFKQKTLLGVVGKYFNDSYLGVVSTFVKEEKISLEELKQLIREVEEGNSK